MQEEKGIIVKERTKGETLGDTHTSRFNQQRKKREVPFLSIFFRALLVDFNLFVCPQEIEMASQICTKLGKAIVMYII